MKAEMKEGKKRGEEYEMGEVEMDESEGEKKKEGEMGLFLPFRGKD